MMREELVFGPIQSRRLGSSLGINVLPEKGKLCNFDCIYCECGWNKDGRDDTVIPSAQKVHHDLQRKLQELTAQNVTIDSITFSGDGEPTLNPEFPSIIDDTLALRDQYYPQAKVTILSNATRLDRPEVVSALKKVDNPILKIDAPTTPLAQIINRPHPGYSVEKVVENLLQFDGNFVLQTCFLRGQDFDNSEPETVAQWIALVRKVHPREIMAYTIDRPTPATGLSKVTADEIRLLVQPLVDEGYKVQVRG